MDRRTLLRALGAAPFVGALPFVAPLNFAHAQAKKGTVSVEELQKNWKSRTAMHRNARTIWFNLALLTSAHCSR